MDGWIANKQPLSAFTRATHPPPSSTPPPTRNTAEPVRRHCLDLWVWLVQAAASQGPNRLALYAALSDVRACVYIYIFCVVCLG